MPYFDTEGGDYPIEVYQRADAFLFGRLSEVVERRRTDAE
jgi:hypothetical protein